MTENPLILACYGAISGIITKTIIAPLERIKLLYQVQDYYDSSKYKTIKQSIIRILRKDGIKGLYYGNGANIIRILPAYSLKFMFNDTYKTIVCYKNQPISQMSFLQLLSSGMLAGVSQATITYPIETLRTRLSIDNSMGRHKNIAHSIYNTITKEGLKTFYQGYGVTFLSTPLYVGLQMSLYDVFKRKYSEDYVVNYPIWCMLSGSSAGLIAQTTCYWGDTIKKQMQTDGIQGKRKYSSLLDCVKQIYFNKGFMGFYPGIKINSIKCIPEAGLQFIIYDTCKTMIKL